MSILRVPSIICSQLDQLNRHLWWNISMDKTSYFTLLECDKLCYLKKLGGMSFKRSEHVNLDFLMKLAS